MTRRDPAMPAPELVLVGSSGRNAGKTTAALALIGALSGLVPVVALKVTTAGEIGAACHRGGDGCGACSFGPGYVLERELDPESPKDTGRLLAAGARASYWLRARQGSLMDGYLELKKSLAPGTVVVAESNSLRRVVEPGLFVMLTNLDETSRPSAVRVAPLADLAIESHGPIGPAAAKELAGRVLALRPPAPEGPL
jgi:hypothetical protein